MLFRSGLRVFMPAVHVFARIPCETQAARWPEPLRERYFNVLSFCDNVFCMTHRATSLEEMICRQQLANASLFVLAACDSKIQTPASEILHHVKAAQQPLIHICPSTMSATPYIILNP